MPAARHLGTLGIAGVALSLGRDVVRVKTVPLLGPPCSVIDARVEPRTRTPNRVDEPLRLAVLGDSSVAGIGADELVGCLPMQVAQVAADEVRRPVHVRGYGASGARTADVVGQVEALDPDDGTDVVLVVVGANDIAHATPPWRYTADLAALYGAIRDRIDVPVVACSMPEMRAVTLVGRPLRDVAVAHGRLLGVLQRRALEKLPGVEWVDALGHAGPGFLADPATISRDGYHPSASGYALLAACLGPAVARAGERALAQR